MGLMFLVHGCNLNHLALKPELESGFCFGLRMRRGGHLSKWPLRGIHRWANVRKFSTTASQSIHSAELINLREQIRRYARSSLLLCAIGEFVRFCRGRWQTPSLNHLIGIESPHGLKRHVELLNSSSSDRIDTNDRICLVLILNFGDAEAANLVLQSRTLQSEPLSGSSSPRDSPRRSSQRVDDHAGFRLSETRRRADRDNRLRSSGKHCSRDF